MWCEDGMRPAYDASLLQVAALACIPIQPLSQVGTCCAWRSVTLLAAKQVHRQLSCSHVVAECQSDVLCWKANMKTRCCTASASGLQAHRVWSHVGEAVIGALPSGRCEISTRFERREQACTVVGACSQPAGGGSLLITTMTSMLAQLLRWLSVMHDVMCVSPYPCNSILT